MKEKFDVTQIAFKLDPRSIFDVCWKAVFHYHADEFGFTSGILARQLLQRPEAGLPSTMLSIFAAGGSCAITLLLHFKQPSCAQVVFVGHVWRAAGPFYSAAHSEYTEEWHIWHCLREKRMDEAIDRALFSEILDEVSGTAGRHPS